MSKSREEWIEDKLKEAKAASGKVIVGKKSVVVTPSDGVTRKAFVPQSDKRAIAIADEGVDPELQKMQLEATFDLPAIRKRDDTERALSMASRLWNAALKNPAEMQILLQRIQSDLWAKGKPIAFDDIKQVADQLMDAASKRQQEEYRKMVSH